MEDTEYKDIEYKEKVIFKARVEINPHSKNTESVDCYVTEGSIAIESSEPLRIPLDRVEECLESGGPTLTGSEVEVNPGLVKLRYRDASGHGRSVEFEADWEDAVRLRIELEEAKRMLLRGRRAGGISYAGFWRRFFAQVVDFIILAIVGWILAFTPMEWLGTVIGIAYFIGFWTWGGQTLGKMFFGVRIVKTDGSPIGIGRAILRYIGYWVSTIIIFVGFLMIAWDKRKQGLHDKIAGTCVVEVD